MLLIRTERYNPDTTPIQPTQEISFDLAIPRHTIHITQNTALVLVTLVHCVFIRDGDFMLSKVAFIRDWVNTREHKEIYFFRATKIGAYLQSSKTEKVT